MRRVPVSGAARPDPSRARASWRTPFRSLPAVLNRSSKCRYAWLGDLLVLIPDLVIGVGRGWFRANRLGGPGVALVARLIRSDRCGTSRMV